MELWHPRHWSLLPEVCWALQARHRRGQGPQEQMMIVYIKINTYRINRIVLLGKLPWCSLKTLTSTFVVGRHLPSLVAPRDAGFPHSTRWKVTEAFLDTCVTINKRVLCMPSLLKILLEADEAKSGDNPFDSWSKLQAMVQKSKTAKNIEWTFHALPLIIYELCLDHFPRSSTEQIWGYKVIIINNSIIIIEMCKLGVCPKVSPPILEWGSF